MKILSKFTTEIKLTPHMLYIEIKYAISVSLLDNPSVSEVFV